MSSIRDAIRIFATLAAGRRGPGGNQGATFPTMRVQFVFLPTNTFVTHIIDASANCCTLVHTHIGGSNRDAWEMSWGGE